MKMTLLGTSCPAVSTRRFGPASLVRHMNQSFLVDCGSGCTQRLLAAGSTGRDLDAIFLTHLHSDHVIDLYQVIISSWHQNRDKPQKIYGPKGTRAFVQETMKLWQLEREARIAHEKRRSIAAFQIDVVEFEAGSLLKTADLEVHAFPVAHAPVKSAFGFVFEAPGQKLVFSGDTGPCDSLVEAALNADVLVHEVFIHEGLAPVGLRTAEGIHAVQSYHTLSTDLGSIATKARAGCLILNHFVPPDFDPKPLIATLRQAYSGPIIIGEDLMTFDLESKTVRYKELSFAL
ncbi:MAG: MBL fold metallo-hydrolase [Planctomycetota bacterium]|nr:MBL fold metallo-hydrolase [Planctomycetota bacterium]